MIDYIKDNNLPVSVREILAHEKLTFPMSNVATTGEILNRSQVAHYGKMEFVVKGRYVKLRGSLHEHAQGGTNYNDFTFPDIQREIEELVNTFHFDPKEAHLNFIEVGVNIVVSTDPTTLVKNFLLYRNKEFKSLPVIGKGYGRKYESQQMMIKVYNKSLQNELPYHLLRFEVKIKRMEFLKKYGINSLTMDDLRRLDVYHKLLKMLLVVFNRIFFFNPELDMDSIHNSKDRELVMQGRFPEYWSELPRQRKSEQIKRFQELTGTNNLKKELAQLISEKWNQLMFPDKLTTLQTNQDLINADKLTTLMFKQEPSEPDILTNFKKIQFIGSKDKIGQVNTTINGYSRTCPVTKVDISMQNKGSRFLSTTGLRWLKDNNPEQYQNILKGFLPNHGIKVTHTKYEKDEITHIAKQIRNQYHNRRRYFDRIPANQLSFL